MKRDQTLDMDHCPSIHICCLDTEHIYSGILNPSTYSGGITLSVSLNKKRQLLIQKKSGFNPCRPISLPRQIC